MTFGSVSKRSPRNKRYFSKSKKRSSGSFENDRGLQLTPKRSSRSTSSSLNLRIQTSSLMSSLGTGALGRDGSVSFNPSPTARSKVGRSNFFSASIPTAPTSTTSTDIIRRCCSFLRVSDLEMDDESIATVSITSDSSNDAQEHSRRPVVDPPPGIEIDPKERWVALTFDDNSNCVSNGGNSGSEHTPVAPLAVGRLANFGLTTTLNEDMWQPDSKSEKLIKKSSGDSEWMKQTFQDGRKDRSTAGHSSSDVLVWMGSFNHGFYGSEVPAIRSAGIVKTSAIKLVELLVDSSRVKDYNKLSLGRTDLITFEGNLEEEGPFGKSITKVMRSESKPPMLSNLVLTSIMHAKKLSDGLGYLIVSRAVHRPEEGSSVASSMTTEIVMGVNLIVDFDNRSDGIDRCLMVNVNHMRSPMVPMYIAKKLAVTQAHKFINDIRALV